MNIGAHIEFICIAADSSDKVTKVNFVPEALHPFNALKIIAEQIIFINFISMGDFGPAQTNNHAFLEKLYTHLSNLPKEIHTGNSALDNIYRQVHIWTTKILVDHDYTDEDYLVSVKTLLNAPIVEPERLAREALDYYTGSITETFVDEWMYLVYKFYDSDKYPQRELSGAPIYLPSQLFQQKGEYMRITKNQKDRTVVMLSPVPGCSSFLFSQQNQNSRGLGSASHVTALDYISQFDLRDYDIDGIIGFLAAFCVHQDQYDMTFGDSPISTGLTRICFDLVTGSSYVKNAGLKRSEISSLDLFLNWVKTAVASGHLKPISDYDLFGNLLAIAGESTDLVNYFTKPVNSILATEAYAFRNSGYADLVQDRVLAGLEAAEDDVDPEDEDTEGGESDDFGDVDDTTDTDMTDTEDDAPDMGSTGDLGTDDTLTGDTDEDTSETADSDKAPIDPNKMLLELNANDPKLKDYLLRDIVARRIASILKNPPENARPNDLLLLKRWQSRWLYLTSIACLKDFLMRLPIRLTDV